QGWCGMFYDSARYEYRGKFAMKRFEQNCLREYAEVIKAAQLIAGGERYEPPTKTFVYVNCVGQRDRPADTNKQQSGNDALNFTTTLVKVYIVDNRRVHSPFPRNCSNQVCRGYPSSLRD